MEFSVLFELYVALSLHLKLLNGVEISICIQSDCIRKIFYHHLNDMVIIHHKALKEKKSRNYF